MIIRLNFWTFLFFVYLLACLFIFMNIAIFDTVENCALTWVLFIFIRSAWNVSDKCFSQHFSLFKETVATFAFRRAWLMLIIFQLSRMVR